MAGVAETVPVLLVDKTVVLYDHERMRFVLFEYLLGSFIQPARVVRFGKWQRLRIEGLHFPVIKDLVFGGAGAAFAFKIRVP